MQYTLLIVQGHRFDGRPLSKLTRKQRFAYNAAYKIELEEREKAQKRAARKAKRRR